MTQSIEEPTTPVRGARSPANAVPSKATTVEKLLSRPRGATTAELMSATSWQNHSVRAFLSGMRKKGRILTKEARKSGDVAYRLSLRAEPVTNVTPVTPAESADV